MCEHCSGPNYHQNGIAILICPTYIQVMLYNNYNHTKFNLFDFQIIMIGFFLLY